MSHSIFSYKETERGHELYIGESSALNGISLCKHESRFRLIRFGATSYKNYGWTTEEELPTFLNVGDVISFLESEGDIGIVNFKADIEGIGLLSTHDDGECHFIFKSKQRCLSVLGKAIPPENRDLLINKLINNPGLYLTCTANGEIAKYSSFSEYLAKNV